MILSATHGASRSRRFSNLAKAFILILVTLGLWIPRPELAVTNPVTIPFGTHAQLPAPAPPMTPGQTPPVALSPQPAPTRPVAPTQPTTPPSPPQQAPAPLPGVAPAASLEGSISGKILDATGAVIPGVIVRLTGASVERSTLTNRIGFFDFSQVPPDRYRLEAALPGFTTKVLNFVLVAGARLETDLVLFVAPMSTTVEVSASRPLSTPPPPAPAATPASPPLPIRVGGVVAAAQLISQVAPVYPPTARAAGIQGLVLIEATIDRSGSVVNPVVVNRVDDQLRASALDAARQWRYRPAMLNGQPVEVITTITVNFSLVD